MFIKPLFALALISVLFICCSNPQGSEESVVPVSDTVWVTVTPQNYLDFTYAKAFAFATVDPFDYSEFFQSETMDPSQFHDTISVSLDSKKISFLNDLLSGKQRKPYPKGMVVEAAADCFYPRHNIIFLDENDSIVNYISVCFECGNMKQSKPHLADMENMETFFNTVGLKVFDRPDLYSEYYGSLRKKK
jgi:hypothetical protein